ncbi:MAG TPA: winged helix-turn-helix transcriptional regulator [Nitrospira sp.]|nr:winged helix-turn-helix transcriptional regulator [Nitrospira sp.]
MDLQGQRDLLVLSEVERNSRLTQRSLSLRLGVALGLTNLYLKRLARKGYIKITTIPRNRIRYLLTPQGLSEKTRLTYLYMDFSLSYYRDIRARLKEMLSPSEGVRGKRFVIYGTSELAELAYLSLRELGVECLGFVDGKPRASFLSYPVVLPQEIGRWEYDKVLIADLEQPAAHEARLIQCGVPAEKILRLGLGARKTEERAVEA